MIKNKLLNLFAFLINLLIILFTIFSVTKYFHITGRETVEEIGFGCFKFFTILSNVYLALVCIISLSFNVFNFINGENFPVQSWLNKLKLSSTCAVTITFVTVFLYLIPFAKSKNMLDECGIYLHLINPLLAIFNFLVIDEYYDFKLKDNIHSIIPLALYGLFYITFNLTGLWNDFYHLNIKKYWYLIVIIFLVASFAISTGLILLSKLVRKKIDNIKIDKDEFFSFKEDYDFTNNAFDSYTEIIARFIIWIGLSASACASLAVTFLKIIGYLTFSSWPSVIAFDVFNALYFAIALIFYYRAKGDNGVILKKYIMVLKIILVVIITCQWNLISYLFPLKDFWGFAFLFVVLVSFFFDYRLVDVLSTFLIISIIISWYYKGTYLLPNHDEYYVANFLFRICCLVLSLVCLHFICFFGGKFLVNQLEKFSDHDPLTTLFNRRKIPSFYEKMTKRTTRNGLSVAIIDIDDFKKVNDTYGHEFGDLFLKEISKTILHCIDKTEVAFRWGGEEFLIMSSKKNKDVDSLLNKLIEEIRNIKVKFDEKEISVTVTIGVAIHSKNMSYVELFDIADNNLYKGKKNGKNQIVF